MSDQTTQQALHLLGEQIAEQAVHLDAAMQRFLADLRRFDEGGGWRGFPSCAHWLSHRVGWDLATARERVRVARALGGLPLVEEALAAGSLSYSKARAITRVATPELEPVLMEYAGVSTAGQLETICRKYQSANRLLDPDRRGSGQDYERYVVSSPAESGMRCIKVFLRPEEAALLMQVIQQAAKDCEGSSTPDMGDGEGAEPAMVGGDPRTESHPDASAEASAARSAAGSKAGMEGQSGSTGQRRSRIDRVDGLMAVIQAYARGTSPHRSPIEMIITTPVEMLQRHGAVGQVISKSANAGSGSVAGSGSGSGESGSGSGSGESETGSEPAAVAVAVSTSSSTSIPVTIIGETDIYLSAETTRRLACDCGAVSAAVDSSGTPLSAGRRTRTIPASIKRALLLRDRTCRFPGCDHKLFLDGHHLQHWADGGETSLSNIALLCTFHHVLVHERGYQIHKGSKGQLRFFDPSGAEVIGVPSRPTPAALGWPAIRAGNADRALSAETAQPTGSALHKLDRGEAVRRLSRAQEHTAASASPTASASRAASASPAIAPESAARTAALRALTSVAVSPAPASRRNHPDEPTADPDWDVTYSHRKVAEERAMERALFAAARMDSSEWTEVELSLFRQAGIVGVEQFLVAAQTAQTAQTA